MIVSILLLIAGLFLLWIGSEFLVKGSSSLALHMGVRPILVGLTVVAMGTSSPELAVSLTAALQNSKAISLGNIIGSNIANIGLVLGTCALINPLKIERATLRNEVPIMIGAILLFCFLSFDGLLSFWDGLILVALFLGFLILIANLAKKDRKKAKELAVVDQTGEKHLLKNILFIILGLAGLVYGAVLIVNSSIDIANALGVSQAVIAVSMVAVGTSLPELAISAVASIRGESELAVGNAVGSNIFNTLFVIAIVAMISPIPVNRELFQLDYPAMLVFTLITGPLMMTRFRISRLEGIFLLLLYVGFIYLIF
ncbi:MAG: calcium/sodium antiporter [candidate division KSB1 bacterium]|nr:calcium/sodium antiporter [candidate division KSB1 bacterium]